MHEIVSGIYFEDSYPGVTLGAITLSRGTVMIDAPLRAEDGRSWRAALLNRGSGIDRVLINLDAHPDRTIGVRSLECTVLAHQLTAQEFQNRSATFKGQGDDTGSEWETCTDLGSSRWVIPDITFTQQLQLHWDKTGVSLEHHPGPSVGAIWVVIADAKVAFIGDAVLPDQPPFLADADIPAWIETLDELLLDKYKAYLLVSGRSGFVSSADIRKQKKILSEIETRLGTMRERSSPEEAAEKLIPKIMKHYDVSGKRRDFFENRLSHGLHQYTARRYRSRQDVNFEEQ